VIRAAMQAQRKAEPRSASFHRTPDEPFRLGGLAATTAGAALLYALTGFGFAVLAAPLVLLFVDPPRAIQLVILISTALSFVTLPGLWRAVATGLLSRLGLGSLAGLPFGLVAFRYADPVVVRALVGATIPAFAALLEYRCRASCRRDRRTRSHHVAAGILIPFALLGALAGRPLGDRVGADAFAILAILLLAAAGLYTLAAATAVAVR
jgi:uncharacterized membrane protein YfcA